MTSITAVETLHPVHIAALRERVESMVADVLNYFPPIEQLSAEERRGIIARYTAVLEGNFIYWMTGAFLSVTSDEGRSIILDNLREEVRDCHPGMMRRFAIAAHAVPTEGDAAAVYQDLTKVRLFIGQLSGVTLLLTMAFFESLIQRFMPYLAAIAMRQGSNELEYTDVHGVCDIAHTDGLFRALEAEMAGNPPEPTVNLFEGVQLLSNLLRTVAYQGSKRKPA